MTSGARRQAERAARWRPRRMAAPWPRPAGPSVPASADTGRAPGTNAAIVRLRRAHLCSRLLLLAYPFVATPFFTFQIGGQALSLGLIALSLTFLAGYGGMVSLAQMTVAGIAGYVRRDLRAERNAEISLGWPWWLVAPLPRSCRDRQSAR